MKKKIISILLAGAIAASLSACGKEQEKPESSKQAEAATSTTLATTGTKSTYKIVKSTTTAVSTQPAEPDKIDTPATVGDATFSVSSNWTKTEDKNTVYWAKTSCSCFFVYKSEVQYKDSKSCMWQIYDEFTKSDNIDGYSMTEDTTIGGVEGIKFDAVTVPDEDDFSRKAVYYVTVYNGNVYCFAFVDRCVSDAEIFGFEDEIVSSISFSGAAAETQTAAESSVTIGMANAVETAKNYLKFTSFSYQGLVDQLLYEKYTQEEAVYGADNCGADWNEQAAKCAESYMEYSSFSRQDLYDQLIYEKFTDEQAEYGVQSVGY